MQEEKSDSKIKAIFKTYSTGERKNSYAWATVSMEKHLTPFPLVIPRQGVVYC